MIKASYTEIVTLIQHAPMSWLPGLLSEAVKACIKYQVFQSGMLIEFVKRIQRENDA